MSVCACVCVLGKLRRAAWRCRNKLSCTKGVAREGCVGMQEDAGMSYTLPDPRAWDVNVETRDQLRQSKRGRRASKGQALLSRDMSIRATKRHAHSLKARIQAQA